MRGPAFIQCTRWYQCTKEAGCDMHVVHGRHPHTSLFYNNSILDIELWLRYLSNSDFVRCSICAWHDIGHNVDILSRNKSSEGYPKSHPCMLDSPIFVWFLMVNHWTPKTLWKNEGFFQPQIYGLYITPKQWRNRFEFPWKGSDPLYRLSHGSDPRTDLCRCFLPWVYVMAGLENRGKDQGSSGWPSCASSDEIEASWLMHSKR